ncbi:MAG TPA: polysaccharide biosynthesis tyrosine autokinase [Tepidisphaeraceae bacterium]|jgi:capsular exopolysaccharide synthesis family protein
MIANVNRKLLEDSGTPEGFSDSVNARPLLLVLWRRRWTVLLTLLAFLVGGELYLLKATRIFTSSSNVYVEQQGVKIMSDTQGYVTKSDSFLYTQAQIIKSAPILTNALNKIEYRQMRTFQGIDNVVAWLQMESVFHVDVGKKDDVLTVSMDSPYPQEAAEVVNSVVDAYVTYQNHQKRTTAAEMMKILQKEKAERDAELGAHLKAMLTFKQENGALSFQDDKGNIILEKLSYLSSSLSEAEVNTMSLRAQLDSAGAALKDPTATHALVQYLQTKGGTSDKELDDLRSSRSQLAAAKAGTEQVYGPASNRVNVVLAELDRVQQQIADKEKQIAAAHVADLSRQVGVAVQKQDDLKAAFEGQKKEALKLNALSAEYARLQADVERTQKQCDLLDSRIKEINVNSEDAGALNIQILQTARAEEHPTKPRKSLTLAAVLLAGLLLGSGLALLRDWADQRLRSPEDAITATGLPSLGIVPHMGGRLSQPTRGQMLQRDSMSAVAEAYRTIRTGIFFGAADSTKTILITSAAPGEGKSITASNLAIAMAQAGHRTLLLDADFRKPVQHKIFEIEGDTGVTAVLEGKVKLQDALKRMSIPRLWVLPVGALPPNPSELMTGKRFSQLMAALTAGFDRVVIDTSPVMPVTDARILAASADVTIMVVRTNKSARKICSLAADSLRNVGANLLGIIVNDMPRNVPGYGYYGYSYYGRGNKAIEGPTRDSMRDSMVVVSVEGNANGNGAVNGNRNGNGNGEHQSEETISINS